MPGPGMPTKLDGVSILAATAKKTLHSLRDPSMDPGQISVLQTQEIGKKNKNVLIRGNVIIPYYCFNSLIHIFNYGAINYK